MPSFIITDLTQEEINFIGFAISELSLKAKESEFRSALVSKMQNQINAQMKPQDEAPVTSQES